MLFQFATSYTNTYATYGNTPFRDVLEFFARLGIYDVILPFLLVFTIIFAVFERTKVLGTEKLDGEEITKKNLNAMASFVIAFLVVASSQAVAIINTAMAKMVVLLFLGVFYLLLIGIFYSEKEEVLLSGGWKILMMVIMFVGIVVIFLHSIPTRTGEPWLNWAFRFLIHNFSTTAVSSLVLLVVILGFMFYVIRDPKNKSSNGHSRNTGYDHGHSNNHNNDHNNGH